MNDSTATSPRRFPPWLKKRLRLGGEFDHVRQVLADLHLSTVCQSARCPNLHECFHAGTATFMILGASCSRNCRFCAIDHGAPGPPDADEPERVAEAVACLGLRYVVVTSVTRDDLPDGGAGHFARTVEAVRRQCRADVEVLTPDFRGNARAVDTVAGARPLVFNHNIETVPGLYSRVRPQADYQRSLRVLQRVARNHPDIRTKSGIMVGLGETLDETRRVLHDLRDMGCECLTIGQYLRPSTKQLPVVRFVTPDEFESLRAFAESLGFTAVASGPFVRSSYHAEIMAISCRRQKGGQ